MEIYFLLHLFIWQCAESLIGSCFLITGASDYEKYFATFKMFAEVKCCKNSRKRKRNRTIVWTDRCSLKNKIFLELGKEKGEHVGKREKPRRDGNFSHGSSQAQCARWRGLEEERCRQKCDRQNKDLGSDDWHDMQVFKVPEPGTRRCRVTSRNKEYSSEKPSWMVRDGHLRTLIWPRRHDFCCQF